MSTPALPAGRRLNGKPAPSSAGTPKAARADARHGDRRPAGHRLRVQRRLRRDVQPGRPALPGAGPRSPRRPRRPDPPARHGGHGRIRHPLRPVGPGHDPQAGGPGVHRRGPGPAPAAGGRVLACRHRPEGSMHAPDAAGDHRPARPAGGRTGGGPHRASGGWTPANLRWLLARAGPVSSAQFGAMLGCTRSAVQQRGGFASAIRDMFPSQDVLIAYRLLFGVCSGIVPDGIDDLVTSDIDWAGDSVILLSYVKGRTAGESLNLPRQAVRLLEQWLSHSALLRSFAGEDNRRRLWLGVSHPGQHAVVTGSSGRAAIQRWVARHLVTGQDGRPLKIHRARIRTTYHAMRDKSAWAGRGRATIDPNHSPQVEGDHYLSTATPGQRGAMEAIVEDAQHDLLRRASPPAVLDGEDAAALARGYPELVASLGLDDTVI